jgi:plasmid stability protein
MRTTLDIPDPLFRHLKARAAMEGSTLRDLVVDLVEKGLQAPAISEVPAAKLPSIKLGAAMALNAAQLSNAQLSEYLNE